MGFFVRPGDAVSWRGPMLHKAMEQFLGQVEWGNLIQSLLRVSVATLMGFATVS